MYALRSLDDFLPTQPNTSDATYLACCSYDLHRSGRFYVKKGGGGIQVENVAFISKDRLLDCREVKKKVFEKGGRVLWFFPDQDVNVSLSQRRLDQKNLHQLLNKGIHISPKSFSRFPPLWPTSFPEVFPPSGSSWFSSPDTHQYLVFPYLGPVLLRTASAARNRWVSYLGPTWTLPLSANIWLWELDKNLTWCWTQRTFKEIVRKLPVDSMRDGTKKLGKFFNVKPNISI
jgi:hypothetical protein